MLCAQQGKQLMEHLGLNSDLGGKDSMGLVTEDAGLECLLHQRQVSPGSATYNLTDYNV